MIVPLIVHNLDEDASWNARQNYLIIYPLHFRRCHERGLYHFAQQHGGEAAGW